MSGRLRVVLRHWPLNFWASEKGPKRSPVLITIALVLLVQGLHRLVNLILDIHGMQKHGDSGNCLRGGSRAARVPADPHRISIESSAYIPLQDAAAAAGGPAQAPRMPIQSKHRGSLLEAAGEKCGQRHLAHS